MKSDSTRPRQWDATVACLVLICLVLAITPIGSVIAAELEQTEADMVCGPRSVQYVLRQFGQEVDLIELVREAQWPELERGASLSSLSDSLQSRGIHTRAIRVPPQTTLLTPFPAIVHLNGSDGDLPGHFVVWLPSSTRDRIETWQGLAGTQVSSATEFWQASTGFALLTSESPLSDDSVALADISTTRDTLGLVLMIGALCMLAACGCRWAFHSMVRRDKEGDFR